MKSFSQLCGNQLSFDGERDFFSLRTLKYFLTWLILWQDSNVSGSAIQILEKFGSAFVPFHYFEIWMMIIFTLFIIERIIKKDYTFKRSYFYGPLFVMGLALIFSWIRGMYILQDFKTVYEFHEAIQLPVIFFIFLNFYRDPGEWKILLVLLVLSAIPKSADGLLIHFYSQDEGKAWGVLQMWRDGFLLALGITSVILLLHYKGKILRWLKIIMLMSLPLMVFTLIWSYRRTFFLAILATCLGMFFTLYSGRRLRHLSIFVSLIFFIFIVILLTDPIGFITRLYAVVNPSGDGSAYIRLMELPNVLRNIYENPIFGTAVGTQWHQYYKMPMGANFTSLGVHNTYLYWPLRTGIFGTIGFLWMLAKMSKISLILRRFVKSEEDHFFSMLSINIVIIYMVGCFFGLLYADGIIIIAVFMVALQLMLDEKFPGYDFRNVSFWRTMFSKEIVLKTSASLCKSSP